MASEFTLTGAQAQTVAAMAADMVREARAVGPAQEVPYWPQPVAPLSLHGQAPPTAHVPLTREAVPSSGVRAHHADSNFHSMVDM